MLAPKKFTDIKNLFPDNETIFEITYCCDKA